mmetsp:Transcript_7579/g.15802  ORF Transcript_7579/g.15802 Transcript_7579/m.15802 type:complete len:266 (-) Transcript_7579:18-815(-)
MAPLSEQVLTSQEVLKQQAALSKKNHKRVKQAPQKKNSDEFVATDLYAFGGWLLPLLVYMMARIAREGDLVTCLQGMLLSYLFIEPASGVLHIVLDNEKFNPWPVLGEVAESFQRHHDDPVDISNRPTLEFALEPTIPCAVIATQALYINSTLSMTTIFFLWPASLLMMFAHRWSHTAQKRKPLIAKLLQASGLVMSDAHHHAHHTTYDNNFAICAGWSNPLMNVLVRRVWGPDDMRWLGVLVGFYFLPTVVAVATGDVGHVSVL